MNQRHEVADLQIENAKIMFRNFKGEPDKFNPTGKRTFAVFLEPDEAKVIEEAGWLVKYLKPREDGDEPQAYLNVEVKFDFFPPTVNVISGKKHSRLNEETLGMLDWAEIDTCDLIIRPYQWEMNGRTGIKAYLKKMWVTLVVDKFEEKYANFAEIDDCPFE